jgi:hypothetical protein
MPDPKPAPESSPLQHVTRLKQMLNDVAIHARQDSSKISDPKAQALFETTAEVLFGLHEAFDDIEKRNEAAWR